MEGVSADRPGGGADVAFVDENTLVVVARCAGDVDGTGRTLGGQGDGIDIADINAKIIIRGAAHGDAAAALRGVEVQPGIDLNTRLRGACAIDGDVAPHRGDIGQPGDIHPFLRAVGRTFEQHIAAGGGDVAPPKSMPW